MNARQAELNRRREYEANREQSFDAAAMFKDRLLDMIRRWEQASHEDEAGWHTHRRADAIENGADL